MKILIAFLIMLACGINPGGAAYAEDAPGEVEPNPLRSVCAYSWNAEYKRDRVDISVSTRGDAAEIVVFTCPECSLEEHFINPFLNNEYRGKTGIERIRKCGFSEAVFKGGRGIEEIVKSAL